MDVTIISAKDAAKRSALNAKRFQEKRLEQLRKEASDSIEREIKGGFTRAIVCLGPLDIRTGWFRVHAAKNSALAQLIEELREKGYRCEIIDMYHCYLRVEW
jgi:hypothetical protein